LTRIDGRVGSARWEAAAGDPFTLPAFEFSLVDRFPTSAEDGMAMIDPQGPPPSGPVILDSQLTGDRYSLTFRNPGSTFVEVHVLHRAGARALACRATRSERRRLAQLDRYAAWFGELCGQVAIGE
jgi:hypothetical protein